MPDSQERNGVCERCQCCEVTRAYCEACMGQGVDGHGCGDDTCCCLDPVDNLTCGVCNGEGGWNECLGQCDKDGKHTGPDQIIKERFE